MERKRNKAKLSLNECKQIVSSFFQKQQRFKQIQDDFGNLKKQFYDDMENYFKDNNINNKLFLNDGEFVNGNLLVKRVQNAKIIFDADKLEKKLGKDISSGIIIKRYEITDISGLITYLKECNVDPKVFKSFICVSKQVDTTALENLEKLGKISLEQIKGCYTVNRSNPYFQVSVSKEKGDEK